MATWRPPSSPPSPASPATPPDDASLVVVAHLKRPQGRRGELIADILTDFPERFADRTAVVLTPPGAQQEPRPTTVEGYWLHKGCVVLKFAGIDSITAAEALKGWDVAVPRASRVSPDEGAVYIADLIGCRVYDGTAADGTAADQNAAEQSIADQTIASQTAAETDIGVIVDVEQGQGGATDMLIITPALAPALAPAAATAAGELLIPFARAYIVHLDLPGRALHMRLPAGLAAINAPATAEERAAQQQAAAEEE